MTDDHSLHQYSHVLANLFSSGKQGALPELYAGIVNELQQGIMPAREDLLLLLESMGPPVILENKSSDQQQVEELIKSIMILLEQDDFLQGAKSYHLNLLEREPINALERRLKTRNFIDAYKLICRP